MKLLGISPGSGSLCVSLRLYALRAHGRVHTAKSAELKIGNLFRFVITLFYMISKFKVQLTVAKNIIDVSLYLIFGI